MDHMADGATIGLVYSESCPITARHEHDFRKPPSCIVQTMSISPTVVADSGVQPLALHFLQAANVVGVYSELGAQRLWLCGSAGLPGPSRNWRLIPGFVFLSWCPNGCVSRASD
jgi:hypothetical protein